MASRFRVRDVDNAFWMDICYFEIYVRNADDTGWTRLLPNGDLFVRNGDNSCWLQIGCVDNTVDRCPGLGDPYDPNNPLSPNRPGVVIGPDGEIYQPGQPAIPGTPGNNPYNPRDGYNTTTGYPPGYYQGNEGDRDPYVIPDPTSPSGQSIYIPSNGHVYTYVDDFSAVPTINVCDIVTTCEDGTYDNPISCPATVTSIGAGFTQAVHYLLQVSGIGRMMFSVYTGTAYFKIFQGGVLLAQTNGEVFGKGELQFSFDLNNAQSADPRIMIQVICSDPNSEWSYFMPCPNTIIDTYGTLVDPAPCHAVMAPVYGQGRGIEETYHDMGLGAGNVVIEYEMFTQPDKLDVFYKGQRIAGTSGFVSGSGTIQFAYTPDGVNSDLLVRVEGQDVGTSYAYRMFCPDQLGSKVNPLPCGGDAVIGQGAGVTDTWIDMGANAGQALFHYDAFNVPDKIDIYQGTTLVATTGAFVSGEDYLGFNYDPNNGTLILVRMTGSTGPSDTTWAFRLSCPDPTPPEVTIAAAPGNAQLPELDATYQLFYSRLTISPAIRVPSSVDYFIVYSGNADAADVPSQQGTIQLNPGDEEVDFSVQVTSDYAAEPDESFSVQIHNPVNVTIGSPDIVTFIILNDDFVTNPDININAPQSVFTEGDTGASTVVTANITLSGPSATPVTVEWGTSTAGLANPATIGSDVFSGSGSVTFNPGETLKTITAIIVGDDTSEPDEQFKLFIFNASGGTIGTSEVTFTIIDDEIPVVPCNNTTNSGGAGVTTTFHDLGASAGTATVSWDMYSIPDKLEIYYGPTLIYTTGGFVSNSGSYSFAWNPGGGSTLIKVIVTGSGSGTGWTYQVFCPS